jgi:hypothetical protein
MLSELNAKFALQLDTCPIMGRSCQSATDNPEENHACVFLAGASHAMRLIDHLELTNLKVIDSMAPGFQITEASTAELSADLAESVGS